MKTEALVCYFLAVAVAVALAVAILVADRVKLRESREDMISAHRERVAFEIATGVRPDADDWRM